MNQPTHPPVFVLLVGLVLAVLFTPRAQSATSPPSTERSRIVLRSGPTGLREAPRSGERGSFSVARYVAASQTAAGRLAPVAEQYRYFELFQAGEFNFDLYFTAAWGDGQCQMTETRRVSETERKSETFFEQIFTTIFDPQNEQDITTVQEVERERDSEERVVRRETITRPTGFTEAYGLGIGTSYFFTRYLGCGLEADWLNGSGDDFFAIRKSFIIRFPIESLGLAPYAFLGLGGQFGPDDDDFISFLGGGAIKRFSPHFGLFVDVRGVTNWDCKTYVQVRSGFQITFGP